MTNTNKEKAAQQAAHPHDHQDYCKACQSVTDMDIDNVSRCSVCSEKYSDG